MFFTAIGAFFIATWHDRARAMPLTKPGTMIVEEIAMEAQWRHRHHHCVVIAGSTYTTPTGPNIVVIKPAPAARRNDAAPQIAS
ncbi:hypothetical protein [Bradyrhizobium sp. URHD0069]|uniref:hypothetical protein n=1 Tax=Bradyrhizobium sp. URHD0069 TaxID=1380355 RepID=UPI0012DFB288|nr:hypothetical protein [Bradyrhizobium sp. URHD0069]